MKAYQLQGQKCALRQLFEKGVAAQAGPTGRASQDPQWRTSPKSAESSDIIGGNSSRAAPGQTDTDALRPRQRRCESAKSSYVTGLVSQSREVVGWLGLEPRTNPESLRGCSTD